MLLVHRGPERCCARARPASTSGATRGRSGLTPLSEARPGPGSARPPEGPARQGRPQFPQSAEHTAGRGDEVGLSSRRRDGSLPGVLLAGQARRRRPRSGRRAWPANRLPGTVAAPMRGQTHHDDRPGATHLAQPARAAGRNSRSKVAAPGPRQCVAGPLESWRAWSGGKAWSEAHRSA